MYTTLVVLTLIQAVGPSGHQAVTERGAHVMGFDQDNTVHRFRLHADGGAVDIAVRARADVANRDAIRSHLPHIAMLFADGNFEAPMLIHDSKVPGTETMAALKSLIRFVYVETLEGGRLDIFTTDPAALQAVHDFMRFQIADHKTGDPVTITKR